MESISKMADPEFPGQSNTTRREFLKTSLVTSVAAATVGATAMGESAAATPESKAEHPSIITVSNTQPSAPLRKPWKNAFVVDVPLLLLREDLQHHLAILQRDIGYRYCRTFGFFQDEMAIVARRKDGGLAFRWAQVDKVLDALQPLRLRPFLNLFPMPVPLASGTKTFSDMELNVTPPRNYAEWGQLLGHLPVIVLAATAWMKSHSGISRPGMNPMAPIFGRVRRMTTGNSTTSRRRRSRPLVRACVLVGPSRPMPNGSRS